MAKITLWIDWQHGHRIQEMAEFIRVIPSTVNDVHFEWKRFGQYQSQLSTWNENK